MEDSKSGSRRDFLVATGASAVATALSEIGSTPGHAQQEIPNSSGTAPPKLRAPEGATDCHMHVYDPRFQQHSPGRANPKNATVSDYRLLQNRLGTSRVVVVTPRNYATDNRITLDAIAQLGASARGVAVFHPTVSDGDLKILADGGIRGIRFSLTGGAAPIVTWDMVEPLANRVADLGWHVQFVLRGHQIVEHAELLKRLPTQLVVDHMGLPTLPAGIEDASFMVLQSLIDRGRTWIKLSGAYINSKIGPPDYPEAAKIAQAFVKAAPERTVWGSDWPHPGEQGKPALPDDALLFDLLAIWAPQESTRQRILVENPESLYGFAKST
jgi:predicted TIM-barrel fold metal-dependent hydrolase